MNSFPLVAFKNNIVINQKGEVFAIYRLKGRPYNNLPKVERELVIRQFEQVLWGIEGKGQILLLCEEIKIEEDEYLANAGVTPTEEAYRHSEAVRRALHAGARNRKRYLALQLNANILENDIKAVLGEFRDTIMGAFFGTEKWMLSSDRVKQALDSEDELYRRISHITKGRADFSDVDFINRRSTKRVGVLPPPLPSRDGGIFTPAILSAISDGCLIEEKANYIKITNGADEEHYQTFITFPDMPKVLPETGAEWLASLDAIEIPVDAVVHFNVIKPHKARKKVSEKRKWLRGQLNEKVNDDPTTDEEYAFIEGRNLEGKAASGQPLATISTTFCVAGWDLKTMRSNAKSIMESYSASGYRAVRPIGDQLGCFYSFIPGSKPTAPSIEVDPGYIAAAGPTVSLEMGDSTGFFIGWSGSSPVFWMPGYAAKKLARSNAIFASGGLGSGKSLAIKILSYLSYHMGAYIFIIDPKNNEYAVLEKLFPIKKIDLCPGGNAKINPFMLSEDPLQAKSIVIDYLAIALNLREDDDLRRIAVTQAVEIVGDMPPQERNMYSCLNTFKDLGKNHPDESIRLESNKCALLMESLKNTSLGSMVFGTNGYDGISRATVVNLKGLPLPRTAANLSAGRITESERQALGLLYLAAVMAREVAFALPPHVVKVEVFDEAWMLFNISEGRRVIDELIRMAARSGGAIPILATQNTTDISDFQTLKNNISYMMCFRAQNKDEIKANLELLGADTGEDNEDKSLGDTFPELEAGWCVMRDALGRIGQVYIDPRPEYLLELFKTEPEDISNV